MYQSLVEGRGVPWDLLVKDVPAEHHQDLDYLIEMMDWPANTDPEFAEHRLFFPKPVRPHAETEGCGYRENWVVYTTAHYSAKELTVLPGRSVTVRDAAAYGMILTQGFGTFGKHDVETPSLIRFGEMTQDELFVTAEAASKGVVVTNKSKTENLVMLKHFGPGNPEAPSARSALSEIQLVDIPLIDQQRSPQYHLAPAHLKRAQPARLHRRRARRKFVLTEHRPCVHRQISEVLRIP
jgi:hypothetical protein